MVFANFHGVNNPTVADIGSPVWYHRECWEEMCASLAISMDCLEHRAVDSDFFVATDCPP